MVADKCPKDISFEIFGYCHASPERLWRWSGVTLLA